jgi:integrase
MKVTIRKRKTSLEKSSIYLDFKEYGVRKKEALNLYVFNHPKNKTEQFQNKKTMELVERMRAEKTIVLQDHQYGSKRIDTSDKNFIDYFQEKTNDRYESAGNYGNWDSVVKHLKKCFSNTLKMSDLSVETCNQFKLYLDTKARTKGKQPLSQNSKYSYLNKFKACLRLAYREKFITENLADYIKGFKQSDPDREYLTFEEVEQLVATKCMYPVLKNAFIFSCLTGIRWSDVQRLTWENLRYSEKRGYELSFRQQKTGGKEYLPISEQAASLLGKRGPDDQRLFVGLKYSAYMNVGLYKWIADAGIKKKITFHCARHTHAVLLLENGVDIFTVSKLLGHRELKTTQIYAKIVDSKKIDAVRALPKFKI